MATAQRVDDIVRDAESDQDEQFDLSDPATVKKLRTDSKKRLTVLAEKISQLVSDRGSRTALKLLRNQLATNLSECSELNKRYVEVGGSSESTADKYYAVVEKLVSDSFKCIDEYLKVRADDPASSVASGYAQSLASVASRTSQLSQASTQLRESQRHLENAEFRIRQLRAAIAEEEQDSRQIRQAQEALEEAVRSSLNRQVREQRNLAEQLQSEHGTLDEGERLRVHLGQPFFAEGQDLPSGIANVPYQGNPIWPNLTQSVRPTSGSPKLQSPPPDAWINNANANDIRQAGDSNAINNLSKIHIKPFSGDPRDWPLFIGQFKSFVHDVVPNAAQRMAYLRELLAPNVRKSISQTLMNPATYLDSLRALQRRYGHPALVSEACVDGLLKLPNVKVGDFTSLETFFNELRGAVTSLRQAGYEADLAAPTVVRQLRDKLPEQLRTKWGARVRQLNRAPTLIDLDAWLDDEVMAVVLGNRSSIFEPDSEPVKSSGRQRYVKARERPPTVLYTSNVSSEAQLRPNTSSPACSVCGEAHPIARCQGFKSLSIEQRVEHIRLNKRCFKCLSPGHFAKDCRRKTICGLNGCRGRHNILLHGAARRPNPNVANASTSVRQGTEETETAYVGTTLQHLNPVLLSVVPIVIRANGKSLDTYALLDPGSEVSIILQSTADSLGLRGPRGPLRLGSYHGQDPTFMSSLVDFEVASRDNKTKMSVVGAVTVPILNNSLRSIDWPKEKKRWSHLCNLPMAPLDTSKVTVLLGGELDDAHDQLKVIKAPKGVIAPRAVLTPFGWCATGKLPDRASFGSVRRVNLIRQPAYDEINDLVKQFWQTDSIGVKAFNPVKSREDERALAIMEGTTRNVGHRYECGLLWKEDKPQLPDNRSIALRRFFALERKLLKNPELAKRYEQTINEYVMLGHARKLTREEAQVSSGKTWYLPHHAVTHPNKPDKVRVVFDASATHGDYSLNGALLKGPDLLTSLLGVLLRFRRNRIPLSADIEKMYHQVLVKPDDQTAFRFLWRSPSSNTAPHTYQMLVHVFGAISSPSICLYVLHKTAKDNESKFPCVANKVIENFYVDNFLDSVDTEEEAITVAHQLMSLLKLGGFRLTKWTTSSREVLSSIPPAERSSSELNMDLERLPCERTLGLLWDCESDAFVFKIMRPAEVTSKRQVLRHIASIFDPLGFLSPLVFSAKILLQDIWKGGHDWDESLPRDIQTRWNDWAGELILLEQLRLPRCLKFPQQPVKSELHVFCDASQLGFGAVAYLRHEYTDDQISIHFVMSKTRVAPLKPISIPRLELQAAVVGLRLALSCCDELRLQMSQVIFWTDSTTVLQWINSSTCKFQTFVNNRIGEILEASSCSQWRHVAGKDNPADDCSRGLNPRQFSISHRWFQGPKFLKTPSFSHQTPSVDEPAIDDPEVVRTAWTGTLKVCENSLSDLMARASTLLRLQRVTALIIKFGERCRGAKLTLNITAAELEEALRVCIRICQEESFSDDIEAIKKGRPLAKNSRLTHLTPFFDDHGILRVGGRLEHSTLSYEARHPIVLPAYHRITDLVIENAHREVVHSSTDRTLHRTRDRYWILRGRAAVKRVVWKCSVCKRRNAKPAIPMMAPLPACRVKPSSPPFSFTGIDYFGPLFVPVRRSSEKRWVCLYTCLTTRAVHLEIARTLDTDSFLMSFRRFVARRGVPAVCYSDNGTNLVSGCQELKKGIEALNTTKIADAMAVKKIEWHFSPPSAPHFGGAWERLIQSAKSALKKVLGTRSVNEEILHTVLVEVEALLNGRPLTHLSVNPTDPEPLTPNHFLLGRAHPNLPPDIISPAEECSRKRWRAAQAIVNHFWARWMREYLPYLIERRKWSRPNRNIQVDDVVLIADNQTPRGCWPVGRVTKTLPGPDGTVRTAVVKTKSGELTRPVAKLCLLETNPEV